MPRVAAHGHGDRGRLFIFELAAGRQSAATTFHLCWQIAPASSWAATVLDTVVERVAAECLRERSGDFGDRDLDETNGMIADQFHRFAVERVSPHAHGWHVRDELIPMDIISEMAELGVFGLTIPEADGGLGLGKVSMCVVTERT